MGGRYITQANMLFYPLYCDIISLTSPKITQTFHLLLGFADNQIVFWEFKIKNSVRITKGLDNRGSTVHTHSHSHVQTTHTTCTHMHNINTYTQTYTCDSICKNPKQSCKPNYIAWSIINLSIQRVLYKNLQCFNRAVTYYKNQISSYSPSREECKNLIIMSLFQCIRPLWAFVHVLLQCACL